ncbi:MAG: hypothetical protein FGF47_04055, partial [Candidatus Brockarchaeota archaeon]|nr:hypothetical protein [Candidatus Brockarchaeota archaeon]
ALVTEEDFVHRFIGSYNILDAIRQSRKNNWSVLYKISSRDATWKLLTVRLDKELSILIKRMIATSYGYTLVLDENKPISSIGSLGIAKSFIYSG